MQKKTKFHLIALSDIVQNSDNPRVHSEVQIEAIAKSIEKFGFVAPVIVTQKNDKYLLIAGHGRYAAAQKLNLERIPAIIVDNFDDKKCAAYMLADNKLTDLSFFDFEKVSDILSKIDVDNAIAAGFSELEYKAFTAETYDELDELFEEIVSTAKDKFPYLKIEFPNEEKKREFIKKYKLPYSISTKSAVYPSNWIKPGGEKNRKIKKRDD